MVMREPTYLAGLGADLAAWLASLVALDVLPLFAVQPILAGSVALTVIGASRVFGVPVRRSDWVAILGLLVALSVLGAAAGIEGMVRLSRPATVAIVVAVPVIAALALLTKRIGGAVALGTVAGMAFGGAAICARAMQADRSLTSVLTDPLALGVVGFGIIGLLGYAEALAHGNVGSVTAGLWVTEIIVPTLVGVWLLNDTIRGGWTVPGSAALLIAIGSTVALARSPGQLATHVNEPPVSDVN